MHPYKTKGEVPPNPPSVPDTSRDYERMLLNNAKRRDEVVHAIKTIGSLLMALGFIGWFLFVAWNQYSLDQECTEKGGLWIHQQCVKVEKVP